MLPANTRNVANIQTVCPCVCVSVCMCELRCLHMHVCAINALAVRLCVHVCMYLALCVRVCRWCCCCCCRCVAVWQLHRYRYTQSAGNCCIQRFVRSPTELILYSFDTFRTRSRIRSSRSIVPSFHRSFARSLVRYVCFASHRFVSLVGDSYISFFRPRCMYACVCVWCMSL